MFISLLTAAVVLSAEPGPSDFHVEVKPRIDSVFGDTASLRHRLDRLGVLSTEMRSVADQFSTAVHETLAELAKMDRDGVCRLAVAAAYERARSAGTHYIELGRALDLEMREVRLAESYGDTVSLTPDYRHKAEIARQDHAALLRELREMQVVFHAQLENEMHYAGCDTKGADLGGLSMARDEERAEETSEERATKDSPPIERKQSTHAPEVPVAAAPIASIVIDSSHCPERSLVTVDGKPLGPIDGGRRTMVRVPQGPHEFCVLPSSDPRSCKDAGMNRHAYVHDGWVLEVRCEE